MEIPETKIIVKHYLQIYEKDYDNEPRSKKAIHIESRDYSLHTEKLPKDYICFDIYDVTEFQHGDEILRSKPRNLERFVRSAKLITIDEAMLTYKREDYFNSLKQDGVKNIVAIRELVTFIPFRDNVTILNEDGLEIDYKTSSSTKLMK